MIAAALLSLALAATPTFYDDFNGNALRDAWTVRGTDSEAGMTLAHGSARAASVSNGRIHLRVIPDPKRPGHYLNGHIGTEDAYEFTYGCAAARVRFQPHGGAHGAFWLLAPQQPLEVQGHEVDVAEYMGGSRNLWHNVYWPDPLTGLTTMAGVRTHTGGTRWARRFHVYEACWRSNAYRFRVDGVLVEKVTTGLSDQPHFLVLSLLSKDWEIPELLTHDLDTYRMDIDWIGVWE